MYPDGVCVNSNMPHRGIFRVNRRQCVPRRATPASEWRIQIPQNRDRRTIDAGRPGSIVRRYTSWCRRPLGSIRPGRAVEGC